MDEPERSPVLVGASFGVSVVLVAVLAVWGAFLVPFRLGGTAVPVSWVVALGGNLLLGRWAGALVGRLGAAVVGVVWLVIAFTLGSTQTEGDLVVPGDALGLGFLLAGAVGSALAYGTARRS